MRWRVSNLVLLAMVLAAHVGLADLFPRIAIIKSSSVLPFNQATDAVLETVRRGLPAPEIITFDLDGDEAAAAALLAEVRRANPRLIITIGSQATAAALAEATSTPIIFSMVLYPEQSGFTAAGGRKLSGATLDVPLAVQFTQLRRVFPGARRVGVLYHPAETGPIIEAARVVAAQQGFSLVALPVEDSARAVAALNTLMEQVEVIWSVADSHVFTPQTTSPLILEALRHRVPLFGLSTAHVRAGALAALTCDYADIGAQTGESALRVLRGEDAASIPATVPRKVALALNLRSARHLGITLPAAVEAEASEVVR
ncbi:MAG: ABC transporter substrate-binding protein [Deltaproteobacteria bacterium]|nr:ABC transporter substrate-binding protein [Deltaproteobacteria bacterium]